MSNGLYVDLRSSILSATRLLCLTCHFRFSVLLLKLPEDWELLGIECGFHLGLGPCVLFFFQSLLLSASIKREGDSPTASPHSSATDDLHHSDRYQVRRV